MIDSPRVPVVTVPGIDGSGPDHWQSLLEAADPTIHRIAPASWSEPVLDDWLAALDRAVAACAAPPVLAAHSLGTLLVASWASRGVAVAGALLVALPHPAGPGFPAAAGTFRRPPRDPLPFPSVLVASSNDPYDPHGAAREYASAWGSRFVDVGTAGHINAEAGFGPWPLGVTLLAELRSAA
ncbi:MAG: alpha/beta hydrolase [Actinoplanes sp.]